MTEGVDVNRCTRTTAVGLLALMAWACCPEVTGPDSTADPAAADGSGPGARFSSLQQQLFDQHCVTDCHETLNAAASLQLDPSQSYQNLVNRPSQQVASSFRVMPSAPDQSYLVRKLEGGPGIVGDQMPRLAPPRPQQELDAVRSWITRGAPHD